MSKKRRTSKKGYIYLIQATDNETSEATGYYKVGMTDDKKQRLDNLQTGNPFYLKMIHCTKRQVVASRETDAHKEFEEDENIEKCIDSQGGGKEWYYTEEKEDYVKDVFRDGVEVATEDVNMDAHGWT